MCVIIEPALRCVKTQKDNSPCSFSFVEPIGPALLRKPAINERNQNTMNLKALLTIESESDSSDKYDTG